MKSRFVFTCITLFVCCALSMAAPVVGAADKSQPNLVLQVAAVLNEDGPTLAFSITNTGMTDIKYFEVGQDPQRVIVVTPDGQEKQYFFSAGPRLTDVPAPVIKPKQTILQKLNAFELFGNLQIKEAGVFRVYWQRSEVTSVYKSNEIAILREEKTPIYNPSTGRIEPPA